MIVNHRKSCKWDFLVKMLPVTGLHHHLGLSFDCRRRSPNRLIHCSSRVMSKCLIKAGVIKSMLKGRIGDPRQVATKGTIRHRERRYLRPVAGKGGRPPIYLQPSSGELGRVRQTLRQAFISDPFSNSRA